jgi:hypothetical protein
MTKQAKVRGPRPPVRPATEEAPVGDTPAELPETEQAEPEEALVVQPPPPETLEGPS